LFLKQQIERVQQLLHGLGIGRQFKPDATISGYRFPVVHLVFANGLRDAVRKGITGRETFSVRQAVFMLIPADGA
jgi:hypothetical protein